MAETADEAVKDMVQHPAHYTDGKIEVWDYILDKQLSYCSGNVVKYISRAGKKDRDKHIEDLKKAQAYLAREIKRVEEGLPDVPVPTESLVDAIYKNYDKGFNHVDLKMDGEKAELIISYYWDASISHFECHRCGNFLAHEGLAAHAIEIHGTHHYVWDQDRMVVLPPGTKGEKEAAIGVDEDVVIFTKSKLSERLPESWKCEDHYNPWSVDPENFAFHAWNEHNTRRFAFEGDPEHHGLTPMRLKDILASWRPGSDDWDWDAEAQNLFFSSEHTVRTNKLASAITAKGFGLADATAPIQLGWDGRVWNGHHRLVIARNWGDMDRILWVDLTKEPVKTLVTFTWYRRDRVRKKSQVKCGECNVIVPWSKMENHVKRVHPEKSGYHELSDRPF